jgi:hypothetical protein
LHHLPELPTSEAPFVSAIDLLVQAFDDRLAQAACFPLSNAADIGVVALMVCLELVTFSCWHWSAAERLCCFFSSAFTCSRFCTACPEIRLKDNVLQCCIAVVTTYELFSIWCRIKNTN